MIDKYSNIIIKKTDSILFVLKKMDKSQRKLMIVMDNYTFIGLISIGDIQRAIIDNISLDTEISSILRKDIKVAKKSENLEEVKARMQENRNEFMPIISADNKLIDVIFWEKLFIDKKIKPKSRINIPVIIMAGGRGTRLAPLTNVLPKPLIPINDKTIIEDIMDKFVNVGCNFFFLSLNYKSEIIKHYFNSLNNKNYKINYFKEKKPLGTAGSLYLLKDKIDSTFFVTNCDIIIDEDYTEILKYHKKNKNEITIVAAVKNFSIPYGTIESSEKGQLKSLTEKPNVIFKINTGMYILEPHLIKEIPINEFYHITFLIEKLKKEDRKVGVFPVSEGSWTDIGNWTEYLKIINLSK